MLRAETSMRESSRGDEHCDKSRITVEAGINVISDPLEERRRVWVGFQLLPQLRLDAQQWKQEAQTTILKNLHHAVFTVV